MRTIQAQTSRRRRDLGRISGSVWSLLLLGVVAFVLWRQRAGLGETLTVLRSAHGSWLGGLLVSALGTHVLFALTLSSLLALMGHRIPWRLALTTYAERQTVASVVPFGAMPSALILTRRLAPLGVRPADAVFAVVLFSALGHLSFLIFLVPVLAWLLAQHAASGLIALATALFLLLATFLTSTAIVVGRGVTLPSWVDRHLPDAVRSFRTAALAHRISWGRLVLPVSLLVLADVAGAASVYAGLRAVNASPAITTAAAGYVVGTLFLLVAPVFQGLGVVEFSMTLALQHLGVPAPHAIAATLLYRTGEVWLPVVFGIALQARHQRRLLGLPAYLPAAWTGFNGLVAVLSVMPLQHLHPVLVRSVELGPYRLGGLPEASRSVILVSGVLLILCAVSLLRWKRTAWVAAVALASMVAVSQLSRDIDRLSSVIAVVNLGLLLLYRRRFRVRSDPPTVRRGLALVALTVACAFAYGVTSLWFVDRRQFGVDFSLRSAVIQTADVLFSLDSAGLAPRTSYAKWLVTSFHLLGRVSVLVAAISLSWPVIWRHRTLPAERERASQLIAAYGRSSLDLFKLWPDKLYFFSAANDGVVSYGLANGVALTLGDPTARDAPSARRLLGEFLDFCDVNGWEPAFHQATPRWLACYRCAGLVPLKIGAEAIVHVDTFALGGKKMKAFRAVVNRYEREGVRAVLHPPPLDDGLLTQLREVSDAWLTLEGRRERSFTLGQFHEAYLAGCEVLVLESSTGRVEAFINLISDGVPGEVTFDLMRHRPGAPNGAMDYLLLRLIELARERGCQRVSLGMVPFAEVGTGRDAAWRERALALLTERLARSFDAAGLWHYKNKFGPVWEPRYLVYRHHARLPAIGLAIARLTDRPPDSAITTPLVPLAPSAYAAQDTW